MICFWCPWRLDRGCAAALRGVVGETHLVQGSYSGTGGQEAFIIVRFRFVIVFIVIQQWCCKGAGSCWNQSEWDERRNEKNMRGFWKHLLGPVPRICWTGEIERAAWDEGRDHCPLNNENGILRRQLKATTARSTMLKATMMYPWHLRHLMALALVPRLLRWWDLNPSE